MGGGSHSRDLVRDRMAVPIDCHSVASPDRERPTRSRAVAGGMKISMAMCKSSEDDEDGEW